MADKKKFEYDLIRCIAIICVVIYHINYELSIMGVSSSLIFFNAGRNITLGAQGVALFVLMAGALSAASFERILDLRQKNDSSVKKGILTYYKKRFLAIFPLFWTSFLFSYFINIVPLGGRLGKNVLISVTGMDGYLSFSGVDTLFPFVGEWYLGMIIILYILFPFIYSCVRKYPRITILILAVYGVLIVFLYPFARPKDADFLTRIIDFTIGIYLYIYIKNVSVPLMLTGGVIFILAAVLPIAKIDIMLCILLQGVSSFIFLMGVGQRISGTKNLFLCGIKRLVSVIARYSYAIFLIQHMVLYWALPPYAGASLGNIKYFMIFIYIALLIGAAAFSVNAVSSYCVNLFKAIFKKKK